jgi:hypothetical protein
MSVLLAHQSLVDESGTDIYGGSLQRCTPRVDSRFDLENTGAIHVTDGVAADQ